MSVFFFILLWLATRSFQTQRVKVDNTHIQNKLLASNQYFIIISTSCKVHRVKMDLRLNTIIKKSKNYYEQRLSILTLCKHILSFLCIDQVKR